MQEKVHFCSINYCIHVFTRTVTQEVYERIQKSEYKPVNDSVIHSRIKL